MKKAFMFASCLLAAVAFTACSDDDNSGDGGDGGIILTPDEAIEAFNTKYDLGATLDVDTATFRYASPDGEMFWYWKDRITETGDSADDFLGEYFIAADNEYVGKVLNFIETEVFPVFGADFISAYMPRTIYFASEVQYHPGYSNREVAFYNLAKDISFPYDGGTCCPEFIMFSHCCSDFDTMDKTYLKRLYISLVVEYIYTNIANSSLEAPTTFNQYSLDYTVGADLWGSYFSMNETCDGYYDSNAEDFKTGWINDGVYFTNSFDEIDNGEALWHMPTVWFQSELRPGRVGACELTYYDQATMDRYDYLSRYYATYFRPSYAQVLGDYVAFIVTTTAAEKEAYYAEVEEALSKADTEEGTPFYDVEDYKGAKTIDDVLPDIKSRVQACKDYFAGLGIVLTDKQ